MAIYICMRGGECAATTAQQPEAFEVEDTQGRRWWCYQRPEAAFTAGLKAELDAVARAHLTRARQAQSAAPFCMRAELCDGPEQLPARLGHDLAGPGTPA